MNGTMARRKMAPSFDVLKDALVSLEIKEECLFKEGFNCQDGLWGKIVTWAGGDNYLQRRRQWYDAFRRKFASKLQGGPKLKVQKSLPVPPPAHDVAAQSLSPAASTSSVCPTSPSRPTSSSPEDEDSEATLSAVSDIEGEDSDVDNRDKVSVYCVRQTPMPRHEAVQLLKNVDKRRVTTIPPVQPKSGEVYVYKYNTELAKDNWRADGIKWRNLGSTELDHRGLIVRAMYFKVESEGRSFRKRAYKLCQSNHPYYLISYFGHEKAFVPRPHGNCTKSNRIYVRTAPEVLRAIKQSKDRLTVQQTYHKLINESPSKANKDTCVPRSMEQVKNVMLRARTENVLNPNDVLATYTLCNFLKDFVLEMQIYPDILITMASPDMFKELKTMLNTVTPPNTHVLHYDTTFDLGDFFVSPLVFRHEMFKEAPSIPLAFLIHQSKTVKAHAAFFKEIMQRVPEINSPRFVVCTDRELAIESAVHSVLPQSTTVNCWNHILQSVKYKVKDMGGEEDDVRVYIENIRELLECETRDLMEQKIAALSVTWSQPFLQYFQRYLKASLISSARFTLKKLGLTLPSITNNVAESFNATIKRMMNWKAVRLERMVFSLFHLQTYYTNEILRGRCNSGNYHLKDPSLSSNFEETTFPPDVIPLEEIERLYKEGEKAVDPAVTHEEFDELMNSRKAVAELIIAKNKISLDPKSKAFIVTGWRSQKYLTTLAPFENCSCNSTKQCCHIIAARLSVGYPMERPKKKFFHLKKLVRKDGRKRSGKKGPTKEGVSVKAAPDSLLETGYVHERKVFSTPTKGASTVETDGDE